MIIKVAKFIRKIMVRIEEILLLPKEQQVAILYAIQDKLDDFDDDEELSPEHLSFIKNRINTITTSAQPTYTWQQLKDQLKTRWDIKKG